jgi:Transposase IS66 family
MHTGGRSAADIDAGGVLDGYHGTIVRDGYAGYSHLTNALRAWCGAHYPERAVIPMGKRFSLAAAVPGLAVSA